MNATGGNTGGDAAGDSLTTIENITGSALGSDTLTAIENLTGLSFGHHLTSDAGPNVNVLSGGDGDDVSTAAWVRTS